MAADGFRLTEKQREAQALVAGIAEHILLYGGSRSAKTFLIVHMTVFRALAASHSRHAMLRFRMNAIKMSIIADTMPKVMRLAFPEIEFRLDKQEFFYHFPNGSQIWCGGLDDKERTEKILGMEFATIFLSECSQIPYASRELMVTRLAQHTIVDHTGKPLRRKMFYDENPPKRSHWTHRSFIEKMDPETRKPLANPQDYESLLMNPTDNAENLPEGYIEKTLGNLSERMKRRFLRGQFADDNPNALFSEDDIDTWRATQDELPDMVRIAIGVDPSGAGDEDNASNDAIGIVAVGLGVDGIAYVLEDSTVTAGPAIWGKAVRNLYERLEADIVVGEANYGGAMVMFVLKTAGPNMNARIVHASRGKVVRAEPFSALYEQGKVRHAGRFPDLEDELCAFSTNGYTGSGSPNRADAAIWALASLFPAIVTPRKEKKKTVEPQPMNWLAS